MFSSLSGRFLFTIESLVPKVSVFSVGVTDKVELTVRFSRLPLGRGG